MAVRYPSQLSVVIEDLAPGLRSGPANTSHEVGGGTTNYMLLRHLPIPERNQCTLAATAATIARVSELIDQGHFVSFVLWPLTPSADVKLVYLPLPPEEDIESEDNAEPLG